MKAKQLLEEIKQYSNKYDIAQKLKEICNNTLDIECNLYDGQEIKAEIIKPECFYIDIYFDDESYRFASIRVDIDVANFTRNVQSLVEAQPIIDLFVNEYPEV